MLDLTDEEKAALLNLLLEVIVADPVATVCRSCAPSWLRNR
jgi:hypothetical protein